MKKTVTSCALAALLLLPNTSAAQDLWDAELGLLEVEIGGRDNNVVPDVPAARVVLDGDCVGPVVRWPRGYVHLRSEAHE